MTLRRSTSVSFSTLLLELFTLLTSFFTFLRVLKGLEQDVDQVLVRLGIRVAACSVDHLDRCDGARGRHVVYVVARTRCILSLVSAVCSPRTLEFGTCLGRRFSFLSPHAFDRLGEDLRHC